MTNQRPYHLVEVTGADLEAEDRLERIREVTVLVRLRCLEVFFVSDAVSELSELRGVEVGDNTALVRIGNLLSLMWSFFLFPRLFSAVFIVLLLFTISRSILGTFSSEGVMGEGVAEAKTATSGCCKFGRKM